MSNDNDYEKQCMFCNNKILMSKKTGSWLPYELNNGPHKCQKKQEDIAKVNGAMKKIEEEKQMTTLTVAEIVTRLKSIGINIDFDIFLRSTENSK